MLPVSTEAGAGIFPGTGRNADVLISIGAIVAVATLVFPAEQSGGWPV